MASANAGPITGKERIRIIQGGWDIWIDRPQFTSLLALATRPNVGPRPYTTPTAILGTETISAWQDGAKITMNAADITTYLAGSGTAPPHPDPNLATTFTGNELIMGHQSGFRVAWSIAEIASIRSGLFDYYVSSDGSDANDGKSPSSPFATLAPLAALPGGTLNGKSAALAKGKAYAPMGLALITANDFTVSSYGSGAEPYFDCTAIIPASWTVYAAGVYTVTLAHNSNAKVYPNYFRGGVPMQKVDSIVNLAGKGNYAVYAANESTDTITLYMNAPADPGLDGAEYRFSRYAMAVNIGGSRGKIIGLRSRGGSHQDGNFKAGDGTSGATAGGNIIDSCIVDWGSRHSVYVGSGTLVSIVRNCTFNGGANDIETGGVLNAAGTANGVVFNSPDHSTATCISMGNVYNSMGRPNYVVGGGFTNFTGPYGHDGTIGVTDVPMLAFSSINDTYIGMYQGPGACGQTNTFSGLNYPTSATSQAFVLNSAGISIDMSGLVAGSIFNSLVQNSTRTNITLNYHDNGKVVILDAGDGTAGFLRAGEGSVTTMNVTFANSSFNFKGCRIANTNKFGFRLRAGTWKMTGCSITPSVGPPVDVMVELGIGGATVTIDPLNGGNTWPVGANFKAAGTLYYGLTPWQAAGKETGSSFQPIPTPEFSESFDGADVNLDAVPGWTRISGSVGDLQRKSNVLYEASVSTTPSVYTRGDMSSTDYYARCTLLSTASNGGLAFRISDASNLLFISPTTTAIRIMKNVAGTVTQDTATSGYTPALNDDVVVVTRNYTDPFTGAASLRTAVIVNGGLYTGCLTAMTPATGSVTKVGAAGRSAVGNLADNASYGPASLSS